MSSALQFPSFLDPAHLVRYIEGRVLRRYRQRMAAAGRGAGFSEADCAEFVRFLLLKAFNGDVEGNLYSVPSPRMDRFWVLMVVETRLYSELCASITAAFYEPRLVHRVHPGQVKAADLPRLVRETRKKYELMYGEAPRGRMWDYGAIAMPAGGESASSPSTTASKASAALSGEPQRQRESEKAREEGEAPPPKRARSGEGGKAAAAPMAESPTPTPIPTPAAAAAAAGDADHLVLQVQHNNDNSSNLRIRLRRTTPLSKMFRHCVKEWNLPSHAFFWWNGETLEGDKTSADYGIMHDDTILVMEV